MKWLFLACAACAAGPSAHAAGIANVRVLGATPTQAVLAYTAPDASPCSLEVSESPSYSPLVHDVNAGLFGGANLDSRTGNLNRGRSRMFVVGKRAAEKAANGRYYSRALQAYTTYYFRITCGGNTATDTFRTANLGMGSTLTEPLPVDRSNPGSYAWPTVDYSQDNLVVPAGANPVSVSGTTATSSGIAALVDVGDMLVITSGLYAGAQRRITAKPGADTLTLSAAFPGSVPAGSAWARRPPNRANNSQVIIDPQSGLAMRRISGPHDTWTTYWEGTTSSAASGGAGWTNADTAALNAAGGTAATYTGDAGNTRLFAHPGLGGDFLYSQDTRHLDYLQLQITGSSTGTGEDARINVCLTVDGATCKTATLEQDLTACASGCVIGTRFPVLASWISPADANGSIVPAPSLFASTGGVLIWKKTASPTSISIDLLKYYFGFTAGSGIWSGQYPACTPELVPQDYKGTLRDGYHCTFGNDNKIYWVGADTADAVLIAVNSGSGPTWNLGNYGVPSGPQFDAADPNSWYGSAGRTGSGRAFLKITYDAAGGKNLDRGPYNAANFQQHLNISAAEITADSFENLLSSFTAAESPSFEPGVYTGCGFSGVIDSRYLMGYCWTGSEMMGWRGIVDTQGPNAGQVIAAQATHTASWPMRFCTMHGPGAGMDWGGWAYIGTNNFSGSSTCRGGHYQAALNTNLLASDSVACPARLPYRQPAAPQCSILRISTDIYDPSPCATENSNPGDPPSSAVQLQGIRVGDVLQIDSERVQVVAKDTCSTPTEPCNLTVLRGVDYTPIASHNIPKTAYAQCTAPRWEAAKTGNMVWDFLNDPHAADASDTYRRFLYNSHGASAPNLWVNDYTTIQVFHGTGAEMLAKNWTHAPDASVAHSFAFAGQTGDPYLPADTHQNTNQLGWPAARFSLDGKSDLGPLNQSWVRVAGSTSLYSSTFTARKQRLQGGSCGMKPLIDVTPGPILDGAGGYYTFCLGECGQGGGATAAYINCPDFLPTSPVSCLTANTGSNLTEMCVFNSGAMFTYAQHDIRRTDPVGMNTRAFGNLGAQYRRVDPYKQMRATFDDKWAFVTPRWLHGARTDVFAVKLPPMDADSVSRYTYHPLAIAIGSVPPGTNNVIAEFGYDPDFRCSSRAEVCVANQAAVNETTPFYWAGESFTGLACASGCTLAIPAIPQRVVYYRLKYRDGSNAVIATGAPAIGVTP